MDFKSLLERDYQRRYNNNNRYSKRAFASDLGISKSCLHDILTGRRVASKKTMTRVAESLGLSQSDKKLLLNNNLDSLKMADKDYSDMFHWQHFVILNLIETKGCKSSPEFFAEKLGVTKQVVAEALGTLKSLNLIGELDGKLYRVKSSVQTTMDTPSHFIRSLHSENLHRAEKALFEVAIDLREMTSLTFAIDRNQFQQIKKETEQFRKRITRIVQSSSDPDCVYTVAVQAFPQTKI